MLTAEIQGKDGTAKGVKQENKQSCLKDLLLLDARRDYKFNFLRGREKAKRMLSQNHVSVPLRKDKGKKEEE